MSTNSLPARPTISGPPNFAFRKTRQPLLWAAAAHSLGIIAGFYLWRPDLWWIASGFLFAAFAAFFVQHRAGLAGPLALGALFFAGAMHIQVRNAFPNIEGAISPFADGREPTIVAHVTRTGRLKQGNFAEVRQVVDVETETVATELAVAQPIHSGIRLSIFYAHSGLQAAAALTGQIFHYGERIRFSGKLRPPRNFRNPGAFDYESYLADNGIAALGSAKAEDVELLPGFSGSRIEASRSRVREGLLARIHQLWQPRDAALIDAMVVGEEAFLDRDTRVDFQRSGTYHVLIVSGMNVSIVAFVIFWTLRRFRLGQIPATLLTVGFCFSYALLTGVGAPVWRATLMCTLYLGTRLIYLGGQ